MAVNKILKKKVIDKTFDEENMVEVENEIQVYFRCTEEQALDLILLSQEIIQIGKDIDESNLSDEAKTSAASIELIKFFKRVVSRTYAMLDGNRLVQTDQTRDEAMKSDWSFKLAAEMLSSFDKDSKDPIPYPAFNDFINPLVGGDINKLAKQDANKSSKKSKK